MMLIITGVAAAGFWSPALLRRFTMLMLS